MKKYALATILAVLLPTIVLAQPVLNQGLDEFQNQTNLANSDLPTVIGNVVRIVLSFLGLVAVVIIIWGGFKWMTSGGNEETIAGAKKLMGAGVVGLFIVIISYAIATFVINSLITVSTP